ncbi:MAG: flagellar motor protein MotB [Desulfovibrionaceae bacterium]|nr:OmpA family protein [Desulfovibrionaceae bacterium]MDD4951194.1 flagellar motor protein MotB [Desulfovibrionaceae bacterium]
MAKKKKCRGACPEMPGWLITFTDMMTLMLTFFVLLVSMAKVDERRKLVVLGSIIGTFGWGLQSHDVLTRTETKRTVEPGPMEGYEDLEFLKDMLWENAEQDIRFESNRFVQVLSIDADVLFEPDSSLITGRGRELLEVMLPVLTRIRYPLLLAGHTSDMRDELGEDFRVGDDDRFPDLSWRLSLTRVLSVYRFLLDRGMDPDMLRLEAFGKFHPHYNVNDPEERVKNRRVDLVLDKRSSRERTEIREEVKGMDRPPEAIDINGFEFRLNPLPRQ